jgi:hypothetical protein
MFADYLPSTDFTNEIRDHAVKDPAFFAVRDKAQPSTIIYQLSIAENWLDPEPGRTPAPRMGPVRLSRDLKHKRFGKFVNENLENFAVKSRRSLSKQ